MRGFRVVVVALALGCSAAGAARAADEPGSADHPLIGRYQGATIVHYRPAAFDEIALLHAPHDYTALLERDALSDRSGPEWLRLEGRLTRIRYEVPPGRSSLEVMRNYAAALKAKGFETLFTCADQACFTGKLKDPYLIGQQIDTENNDSTRYFDHARYLLARLARPEGDVHAAILVGEVNRLVSVFVAVVEAEAMEDDRIQVDAGQMARAIAADRKVSVYGIVFDYDDDTLKPESKPTLDAIAKLLEEQPQLRLEIVGHTDNRGTPQYNLDLSRRRAASVVEALTRDYGIAPDRLASSGAGMTAPVASNDTEEGRAKNRRVELVAR